MSEERASTWRQAWSGQVLTALVVVMPVLSWLAPRSFALVIGVTGLALAPTLFPAPRRIAPLAMAVATFVAWAVLTGLWSSYHPEKLGDSTALKLIAQALLYGVFVIAASRVEPGRAQRILRLLTVGLALLGGVLLVESATGAALFSAVRRAIGDPIRSDLAGVRVAQGIYGVLLLLPTLIAAQSGRWRWLLAPAGAGVVCAGLAFDANAPVLAAGAAVMIGLLCFWRTGPALILLGGTGSALLLLSPWALKGLDAAGAVGRIEPSLPLSWAQRLEYWRFAVARIGESPVIGWGLDASRTFAPSIQLHPHNGALQIWLETGGVGALLATACWCGLMLRIRSMESRACRAAAAAAAAAYLLIFMVSFGIWQEWWLGLGALAIAICGLGAAASRRGPASDAAPAHDVVRGEVAA